LLSIQGVKARLVLSLALAACGARIDTDNPGSPDGRDFVPSGADADLGGSVPDAAPAGPIDAAPDNACGVASTQGDLGTITAAGSVTSQGQQGLNIYSLIAATPDTAADPAPDAIYIELWDNYGAFLNGTARTGTFPISGDELSYQTCGVCVFTLADVDPNNGPTHLLLATGGSVTVNAVSTTLGGALSVQVQGVAFQEVDAQNFQPVPGSSCTSPVSNARLDGTVASVN